LVRAEILLSNNRADEAAKIYRQLYVAKDSTFSKEMRMQLDELNTIFKVDELKMQGQLQRSRFIAGIAALAFLVLLLFMYFRHRAAKRLKQAHGQLQDAHERLQSAYDQLEETTAAKERIESELRIARDIQMSMVPHVFPEYEGLDLYASMTPAREVGGDLYGYLIDGHKLYFCVGDVSGKGVPASLFMAQAERLFRTLAGQHMMPAEIITRMNTELGADNNQGMFVTMFLGLLDMTTGRLDFCNAGHNPPVIGGDATQGTLMQLESNAPIGLWPEMEFVGESIDNVKGKPLFIYTDGLTEAENLRQEQFSEERMLSILRQTRFNNSRQVVETLEAEADKFRAGADPNDDLTLMCLRLAE
jgi:serine phosphatase RsbU (regulator of sigma subunit)